MNNEAMRSQIADSSHDCDDDISSSDNSSMILELVGGNDSDATRQRGKPIRELSNCRRIIMTSLTLVHTLLGKRW